MKKRSPERRAAAAFRRLRMRERRAKNRQLLRMTDDLLRSIKWEWPPDAKVIRGDWVFTSVSVLRDFAEFTGEVRYSDA